MITRMDSIILETKGDNPQNMITLNVHLSDIRSVLIACTRLKFQAKTINDVTCKLTSPHMQVDPLLCLVMSPKNIYNHDALSHRRFTLWGVGCSRWSYLVANRPSVTPACCKR